MCKRVSFLLGNPLQLHEQRLVVFILPVSTFAYTERVVFIFTRNDNILSLEAPRIDST